MHKKTKSDEPKRRQHDKKYLLVYSGGEINFDEPHKQSFYGIPLSDTSGMKVYKDGDPFELQKSYPSYTAFWKHLAGIK